MSMRGGGAISYGGAIGNGGVGPVGTHAELLAQGGLYAHLYATQFNREAFVEYTAA